MDNVPVENAEQPDGGHGGTEAGHAAEEAAEEQLGGMLPKVSSASVKVPASRRPSKTSAASGLSSVRGGASVAMRNSVSVLAGRSNYYRSTMSMPGSRVSITSRSSRATAHVDFGLSPGLQQLIQRITDTKDVGLIAYLSAIPGEPLSASKPPAAIARLHRSKSARPKSIIKISKPQVRFEPTYRLEPMRRFGAEQAHALTKAALELGLADATYSETWATDASRILAAYITQCIKSMDLPRYKIATLVYIVERHSQGVRSELAVLWDADRDCYCCATAANTTLMAMAVVYAVYWD